MEQAGDNRWDKERTKAMHGQRRKNHVDSTLFPLGFDEVAHDLGYGKGQIKNGQRSICQDATGGGTWVCEMRVPDFLCYMFGKQTEYVTLSLS